MSEVNIESRKLASTPDRGQWTQTYTGIQFFLTDPRPGEVNIVDIAHALSMQCRYGGHCREFYSVAEHSLAVSYIVPPGMALEGLLHDAAEAYICDVPRPLKQLLGAPYSWIEAKIMTAINERYGTHIVDKQWDETLKWADNTMLHTEMLAMMAAPPKPWVTMPPALENWTFYYYSPLLAKRRFYARFSELYEARREGR